MTPWSVFLLLPCDSLWSEWVSSSSHWPHTLPWEKLSGPLLGRQESTLTVPPVGLLVVTITLGIRVPSEEGLLCLSFLLGLP